MYAREDKRIRRQPYQVHVAAPLHGAERSQQLLGIILWLGLLGVLLTLGQVG